MQQTTKSKVASKAKPKATPKPRMSVNQAVAVDKERQEWSDALQAVLNAMSAFEKKYYEPRSVPPISDGIMIAINNFRCNVAAVGRKEGEDQQYDEELQAVTDGMKIAYDILRAGQNDGDKKPSSCAATTGQQRG